MFEKNPRLSVILSKEDPKKRKFPVHRRLYKGSRGDNPELTLPDERVAYGDLAEKLGHRLTSIPGVIECAFRLYQVSVRIGPAFDWKEVGPMVMGTIAKAVYPDIAAGRALEANAQINLGSDEDPDYAQVFSGLSAEVASRDGRLLLDIERMLEEGVRDAAKGSEKPARESGQHASLHAA